MLQVNVLQFYIVHDKNKPGSSTNMLLQPVIIVLHQPTKDGMATKNQVKDWK